MEPESPFATSSLSSASQTQTPSSRAFSPVPPSVVRLWRPAAQRNLRNQWSKLASYRPQWASASSAGKSHATSLVNSFLSQKYMPSMELGVLKDMPDIQKKACAKLLKQQKLHESSVLSSYKEMVTLVVHMVNTSRSMRCYIKGTTSSPLAQFSSSSEDSNDNGDGGGIPVYTFLSVSYFEQLADELVQMFKAELRLKRLLVVELLSLGCEDPLANKLCWSNELYPGEFDDLVACDLYDKETGELVTPRLGKGKHDTGAIQFKSQPDREILQVYLTTWLTEVNMDTHRVDEIFGIAGEEMRITLS